MCRFSENDGRMYMYYSQTPINSYQPSPEFILNKIMYEGFRVLFSPVFSGHQKFITCSLALLYMVLVKLRSYHNIFLGFLKDTEYFGDNYQWNVEFVNTVRNRL